MENDPIRVVICLLVIFELRFEVRVDSAVLFSSWRDGSIVANECVEWQDGSEQGSCAANMTAFAHTYMMRRSTKSSN